MKRLCVFFFAISVAMQTCPAAYSADFCGGADKHLSRKIFSYRSFWPQFEAMKNFDIAGVNTVALMISSSENSLGEPYGKYPNVWVWKDAYNWESFDRQFDELLAVNPDAEIICIVDLNSPHWFARQLAMDADGQGAEGDSFTMLTNCLPAKDWLEPTKRYAKKFLERAEKKYGKNIRAYLLVCGQTDEWMDRSAGIAGRAKTTAWESWLQKSGCKKIPVPEIKRLDIASFENFIRDPASEGDIIKYAKFTGDLVVDGLEEFAKLTRETVGDKKLIGAFYGYILDFEDKRLVWSGHLEYERAYSSKYVDFFQSPATYYNREIGMGSGFMCAHGTLKRLGKTWLHEIDHRTHTYNPKLNKWVSIANMNFMYDRWRDQSETDAGLKREFALVTVNGESTWCFDMWGGVFSTPETMKLVERAKKIWDAHAAKKYGDACQTALIVDPQSARYINDRDKKCIEPYLNMRKKLNSLGAPFEVYSFGDIGKSDLSKYKFLIFPTMFELTPEREKILKDYVMKDGKTLLFLYAPAISDGKSLDVSRVKKFVGFDRESSGINVSQRNGWTCAYIKNYTDATSQVLRELAKNAGVHFYTEESLPVFANQRLVAVHVKNGGKKKIFLPKKCKVVRELFTNRTVAENVAEFIYDFKSPDTALFETEY